MRISALYKVVPSKTTIQTAIHKNTPQRLRVIAAETQIKAVGLLVKVLTIPKPTVFQEQGSSLQLCQMIAQQGLKHICLVTDEILYQLKIIDPIQAELERLGLKVTVFAEIKPDPTVNLVNSGIACLKQHRCDAILAVGGGSAIDCAKVMALAITNKKSPEQLYGILRSRKRAMPLYVIPSTAGTGSEVSGGAVITDDITHEKNLILDPKCVPLGVALDAAIMRSMPRGVTAETGIDALTHALEAWLSRFSTKASDKYALEAMRAIFSQLESAWLDGSDMAARESMAVAAHNAGLAMNITALGYVHAIAHQLGVKYHLPHGRANAIVLPYILDFSQVAAESRLAKLARGLGFVSDTDSDERASNLLINRVKALISNININVQVPGINKADFPSIIQAAFKEAHGLYAVPKYMTKKEMRGVLEQIRLGSEAAVAATSK
jgi:alcohol dehydrogenase